MYCAVSGSSNTVSFPSVTVTESLVQVTVVAGPPVEIQVRVFPDNVTPPGMVISPCEGSERGVCAHRRDNRKGELVKISLLHKSSHSRSY